MDFEKLANEEESPAANDSNTTESSGSVDRYNTRYLVADLKSSNRTPKIIMAAAAAIILIGGALAFILGGNNGDGPQTTTTPAAAKAISSDHATDSVSDK